MDLRNSQFIVLVAGIGTGFLLGAVIAWLIMRGRVLAVRSDATTYKQAEIAQLTEKISGMSAELSSFRGKEAIWEKRNAELLSSLDVVRDERARFEERAGRLSQLESELEGAKTENEALSQHLSDVRERLAGSTALLESQGHQVEKLEGEAATFRNRCDGLLSTQEDLKTNLAESRATLESERSQVTEKLALINGAKEQLADRFKALANDILEEKTTRFTEQNQKNIGQILEPLRVKINEFQEKVEHVYVEEGRGRTALSEQVKQLLDLNQQLSQDANNLAAALKGSSKTQGIWGELVLENILEASGLRKGHEYDVRENYTRPDGTRVNRTSCCIFRKKNT